MRTFNTSFSYLWSYIFGIFVKDDFPRISFAIDVELIDNVAMWTYRGFDHLTGVGKTDELGKSKVILSSALIFCKN